MKEKIKKLLKGNGSLTLLSIISLLTLFFVVCVMVLSIVYRAGIIEFPFDSKTSPETDEPFLPSSDGGNKNVIYSDLNTKENIEKLISSFPYYNDFYAEFYITYIYESYNIEFYRVYKHSDKYRIEIYDAYNEMKKKIICDGTRVAITDYISISSAYSLYGSSISIDTGSVFSAVLMIFSLAVFPAITEEFVFRGIMMREYRMLGSLFPLVISSLLFAFIHFDLLQFPIYFVLGFILSWMVFLTRSVISAVIAHIVYNVFVIFGEKYIWLFSSNPDSDILFFLILVVLLLVCLFLFFTAGERILRYFADNGEAADTAPKDAKKKAMLFDAFLSLPMMGDFLLFLIVGIISAV